MSPFFSEIVARLTLILLDKPTMIAKTSELELKDFSVSALGLKMSIPSADMQKFACLKVFSRHSKFFQPFCSFNFIFSENFVKTFLKSLVA